MSLLTNLVSYWKFDEASGNAFDSKGNNDLTNVNTTAFTTGKINNCPDLVATSSNHFSIADAAQTGLEPAQITVSAWVKLKADANNTEGFVYKAYTTTHTSPYQSYYLSAGNDASLPGFGGSFGGSPSSVWGTTTMNVAGGWYHLVGTYDGTNAKIYVNGSLENTEAKSAITYSNGAFVVGRNGAGTTYFNGYVDEVGIWSRAITLAEVQALYNEGNGLQYPFGLSPLSTSDFFQLF